MKQTAEEFLKSKNIFEHFILGDDSVETLLSYHRVVELMKQYASQSHTRIDVNTATLEQIYQEWRGNKSCYDTGRPVFEASELLDFAEYCLKYASQSFPSKEEIIMKAHSEADKVIEYKDFDNFSNGFMQAVDWLKSYAPAKTAEAKEFPSVVEITTFIESTVIREMASIELAMKLHDWLKSYRR